MDGTGPLLQSFPIGTVLADAFVITTMISSGPSGQIYAAYDQILGRDVVIKAALPGRRGGSLRQEARALAAFQHPGLVSVHACGVHSGREYLVLEKVAGMTLADHFSQRTTTGGFALAEIVETLIQVSDTLGAIHSAGLAHLDLRPKNILLAAAGRVVLVDFGVAHNAPLDPDRSRYVSPDTVGNAERITDKQMRDLYALGLVAFEMLTGALPDNRDPVADQLARICAGVPEPLSQLVGELLSTDPGARPRSADLVGASLRAISSVPLDRSATPLSIVIADDDPDMSRLLALVIRKFAPVATIQFAEDGAEALRLVQRAPPDILFLDLQMPKVNGLEVCMYLRGTSLADRMTICVISQFGESHRAVLKQLGIIDILAKQATSEDELSVGVGRLLQRLVPSPSPTPASEPSSSTPTVGGRYILEGTLGEGGMGRVYRARHVHLGKRFALKIISASFANDTEARERFNQEAKLASEISHPNIVSVVDFGEDRQLGAYMVMELLRGETLADAGKLSIRRACDVLGQTADALDLIHRHGIIHGDVKADNIMLIEEAAGTRRRRIARLLDFGLAQRISLTSTNAGFVVGTPHYLAPERALGGRPSVASDVYALGVLGYFLLTGQLPFDGEQQAILEAHVTCEPPPMGPRRGEDIDPALEALILRAMSKDVALRHPSAAAFHYELNAVMDMLDLGRRKARATGSENQIGSLTKVFTQSGVPQAVLSADGSIVTANQALGELLGAATVDLEGRSITSHVTGRDLREVLAEALAASGVIECRARLDRSGHDLVLWLSRLPAPGNELHLLIKHVPASAALTI